jgi:hypothetical protein
MEIDSTTAAVTVNVALPDTDPDVAVTIVDPAAKDVASPEVALTEAVVAALDVHATIVVNEGARRLKLLSQSEWYAWRGGRDRDGN